MRHLIQRTVLVGIVAGLVAAPGAASAQIPAVSTFTYTKNLHPLGFSERAVPLDNTVPGAGVFNSDLAFQGNMAVQGTYAGFRLIAVSDPENPVEIINWTDCASPVNTQGNQGDVIIWGDLVIRSWNSPAPAAGSHCGDMPVAPGDVNMVACAGSGSVGIVEGPGVAVFTIDPDDGASKVDPQFLYYKVTGGISLGHSASFTWDGEVIIVGHEPGGGGGARCQATSDPLERTFFYVDADTGDSIGQFTIPRTQTNTENCTTHNYNVVPLRNRYVMVSGNYQSGISVIDFTDPTNAKEIAYADPAPLVDPNP